MQIQDTGKNLENANSILNIVEDGATVLKTYSTVKEQIVFMFSTDDHYTNLQL